MIKQKPLQIFSKDADMGIDVVKSPVKLTILEMLRSNDMEFDEIVRNTGKSKWFYHPKAGETCREKTEGSVVNCVHGVRRSRHAALPAAL